MQFVRESHIAAPRAAVFAFHERPEALVRLTPPWENMRVLESSGSLQPGSRLVLAGRVGPLPVRWVALHTEYGPPHLFSDRQETGPFASWYHPHCFEDDSAGDALLRDEVEYTLPFGFLGRWFGCGLDCRKLERMCEHRHETTRRAIEDTRA